MVEPRIVVPVVAGSSPVGHPMCDRSDRVTGLLLTFGHWFFDDGDGSQTRSR
jgi:hypothetical protein